MLMGGMIRELEARRVRELCYNWAMLNQLRRIESMFTSGPWWWRYIGSAIVTGIIVAVYFALG